MKKELEIPKGYEFEKVEEGKVILKKIKPKFPTKISDLPGDGLFYIDTFSEKASNNLYDMNLCDTKEEAEAFLFLMLLKRFCNAWNKIDNFVPIFGKHGTDNICVRTVDNKIQVGNYVCINAPLSFSSRKRAEQFLEAFRGLLEIAKPLL